MDGKSSQTTVVQEACSSTPAPCDGRARIADIQSVSVSPTKDCYEILAVQAVGAWPPAAPPGSAISTVSDVLRRAAETAPLVSFYRELIDPDSCWIGSLGNLTDRHVSLLEVRPRRQLASKAADP